MNKIVINPKYAGLSTFIESIPSIFSFQGESIYKERNELKCYIIDGYNIIVKRFKKPHLINRIAYTFFRPSKAKRAYEYALRLLELGLDSPSPIAYIEQYRVKLLTYGYFVSVFEKEYTNIRDLMEGTEKDETLLKELSLYVADLHNKGVLHLDLSPGNVMYKKVENKILFTLVDINRMQFFPSISNEDRLKNFKRLSDNAEILTKMAGYYAAATGINETETIEKINRYSSEFFASRK